MDPDVLNGNRGLPKGNLRGYGATLLSGGIAAEGARESRTSGQSVEEALPFGSLGRPSTRSPTMLRWISAVPPQMVSDLEKKNEACRLLTG